MNGTDEIVNEVRAIRDAYAASFGYDLKAIYEDLKAKEQESNHELASLEPLKPQPSNQD